jgi:hypothetical protein
LLIVWHMRTCFSISPFFCCCCVLFFCDFFRHTVDIQTTQISVDKQQGSKTPRQALAAHSLEGVHFRACFADSWVAESAHSMSRQYYPLIGCSPGVPLKALKRLTSCLSGGYLLRVSSTASVCVKVVYEFACCLCATCVLFSHFSVFSITTVCCPFCNILRVEWRYFRTVWLAK